MIKHDLIFLSNTLTALKESGLIDNENADHILSQALEDKQNPTIEELSVFIREFGGDGSKMNHFYTDSDRNRISVNGIAHSIVRILNHPNIIIDENILKLFSDAVQNCDTTSSSIVKNKIYDLSFDRFSSNESYISTWQSSLVKTSFMKSGLDQADAKPSPNILRVQKNLIPFLRNTKKEMPLSQFLQEIANSINDEHFGLLKNHYRTECAKAFFANPFSVFNVRGLTETFRAIYKDDDARVFSLSDAVTTKKISIQNAISIVRDLYPHKEDQQRIISMTAEDMITKHSNPEIINEIIPIANLLLIAQRLRKKLGNKLDQKILLILLQTAS